MDCSSFSSSERQFQADQRSQQQAQQQKPRQAQQQAQEQVQQQAQQQAQEQVRQQPQYASRSEIRRAIYAIVHGIVLRRMAERAGRPVRTSGEQRARCRRQSCMIEDLLYRRSTAMENYQDPSTLERRIHTAARVIFQAQQQRAMEAESRRRLAAAAAMEAARLDSRRMRGFR